jgi:hypothetical protein
MYKYRGEGNLTQYLHEIAACTEAQTTLQNAARAAERQKKIASLGASSDKRFKKGGAGGAGGSRKPSDANEASAEEFYAEFE